MVKVQRFEELKSWQKARELSNAVFEVPRQINGFLRYLTKE